MRLCHAGRTVWLKWHQLRRHRDDPAHDRVNLALGVERGASLEVDILATRDGHFVCLHDADLGSETTGQGAVWQHDRAAVERLRQRANDGTPLATPPLFLDEAIAALASAVGWSGRLQLDLKQPAARIDAAMVERFAALIAPVAAHVMLGGTEWRAVCRLGAAVPDLRPGFDPLEIHEAAPPASAAEFEALAAYTVAHARQAAIYYLHIPTVLRGLDRGVDLVRLVKANGAEVDVWRLEPEDDPDGTRLARLLALGVDQITTDSPEALAALWQGRVA